MPFNDLGVLERPLDGATSPPADGTGADDIGIVLPEAGYLDAVRELTRRHGVPLVIDETHTICAGPGGCTAAWGLEPDSVVVGKPIGGGVPVAAYGMTDGVAHRLSAADDRATTPTSRVGGTLTGERPGARGGAGRRFDPAARGRLRGADPARRRWTDGVDA